MMRLRTVRPELLATDQAEDEDRDQDHDHQELGPAARMRGRVAPDGLDRQRVVGLQRVDRHVLGAVVWNVRWTSLARPIRSR